MFSFFSCNKNKKSETDKQNVIVNKTEELPFLGTITLSNARDYEVDNVKINNNNVSIDLNFDGDEINPETLKNVRSILENIENIDKKIKKEFREYIEEEGMVREYFNFYIEGHEPQILRDYLKDTDQNLTTELQLLSITELNRIGFYPDSSKYIAVLDYRVLIEYSDQILVVLLNEKGEIEKITIES
jgi:hypothetical protein